MQTFLSQSSRSGFAPVLNPFRLVTDGPVETLPNHLVQRATPDQIEAFRDLLESLSPFKGFTPWEAYQCRLVETPTANGTQGHFEPLPESEWYYNVVTFTEMPHRLHVLEEISNVADVQLEVPYTFYTSGAGSGYPGKVSHFLTNHLAPRVRPEPVTESMLRDISAAYSEMLAVRDDYPEVVRALSLFDDLKSLPKNSAFEILGLFAIIEMLITHNPKHEDVGDSITHQMKSKIPLLSKRFRRPLDYSPFGECSEDKVWSRLYQYRSILAHGGQPSFERAELAVLGSAQHVLTFLHDAVRALIRHSFKEPQLYRDLKEC